ncbi:hypothetical protein COT47_03395 [Candidatus Woesearchaeota archaeon CG08_land_8_20_14_0_20_43_7]|nr:MAG: hypothetical protein COT47_03395 [Candidatus Woesearchaeota archaeon CG08_land_8_20_14_0_20_43_7]
MQDRSIEVLAGLPDPIFRYNNSFAIILLDGTDEKTVEKILEAIRDNPKTTQYKPQQKKCRMESKKIERRRSHKEDRTRQRRCLGDHKGMRSARVSAMQSHKEAEMSDPRNNRRVPLPTEQLYNINTNTLTMPKKRTLEGPASIFKRMLAFVIDMLLLDLVIASPFSRLIAGNFQGDYAKIRDMVLSNPGVASRMFTIILTVMTIMILYFALTEFKLGQSFGKMLLQLRVRSDTKDLRLYQCLLRSIFLIPVFPFILLWIADPLSMAFTKDSRRLSEILSKTRTVQDYVVM